MSDISDALDQIFTHARDIIENLGDQFTSQQFLRLAIHDQQHAYIDLLIACRGSRKPVQRAHSRIGRRLRDLAVSLGYTYTREAGKEKGVFHTPTTRTTYTRRRSETK